MNTEFASRARADLPFLPSDLARPDVALVRSITARFIAAALEQPEEAAFDLVRKTWPRDGTTELVLRGAVSPTSTTTAASLAGQAVGGFVASLAPEHASSRLLRAGITIPLGRNATVSLPGVETYPTAPFVTEGAPIPVGTAAIDAAVLGPAAKIAIIAVASRRLADTAVESVEATIGALLRESCARALDSALFGNVAGTTDRPAGLLYGVSPRTASSGAGLAALLEDVRGLIGEIADAGGGSNVMLFAHPGTAVALKILAGVGLDLPLIGTPSIAQGTVVAVDAGAFASGFNAEPEVDIATMTTLHMDTVPQQLGQSGSATAPIRSLFQTDSMAIRMILRCSWAMRGPLVSVVSGVVW